MCCNLEAEVAMWEQERWEEYHNEYLINGKWISKEDEEMDEIKIPEVDNREIPEDELLDMWEATPEEQEEIDDILADFGLDFE